MNILQTLSANETSYRKHLPNPTSIPPSAIRPLYEIHLPEKHRNRRISFSSLPEKSDRKRHMSLHGSSHGSLFVLMSQIHGVIGSVEIGSVISYISLPLHLLPHDNNYLPVAIRPIRAESETIYFVSVRFIKRMVLISSKEMEEKAESAVVTLHASFIFIRD